MTTLMSFNKLSSSLSLKCFQFFVLKHSNRFSPSMSRLIERFLMDDYKPHQLSTYALTLFRYKTRIQDMAVSVGLYLHASSVKGFLTKQTTQRLVSVLKDVSLIHRSKASSRPSFE